MDQYIERKLADFIAIPVSQLRRLSHNERNKHFEDFANFHILKRWHLPGATPAEVLHVSTGATDDNQIDGYGVMIGSRLLPCNGSEQDAGERAARVLEEAEDDEPIHYIFTQTTTTESFAVAKMTSFVAGVNNCFEDHPFRAENDALRVRRAIKNAITRVIGGKATERVSISLYYVALGTWQNHPAADRSVRDSGAPASMGVPLGWRKEAETTVRRVVGSANTPQVEVLDRGRLAETIVFNEAAERAAAADPAALAAPVSEHYSRSIEAPQLLRLPALSALSDGYIGYLPACEFLKLLEREDGQGMLEQISFSNVRAYLGDNAVNTEIAATLAGEGRSEFLLLNNGVTVVARKATWRDGRLTLVDYQIVNGLQTSHILYRQRAHLAPPAEVAVPVKIVVTTDRALLDRVVHASNRQTVVTDLQHEGHSPFVMELWRAFAAARATPGGELLWLERREGEYDLSPPHPDADRVISLAELLSVVTATHLRQPHVAASGVAAMRSNVPRKIFGESHRTFPYVVAARLLYRVWKWLEANAASDIERFEPHLCYGLYLLAAIEGPREDLASADTENAYRVLDRRLGQRANVDRALGIVAEAIRGAVQPLRPEAANRRSNPREWREAPRTKRLLTTPLQLALRGKRSTIAWE
jgi:hypothetical protein